VLSAGVLEAGVAINPLLTLVIAELDGMDGIYIPAKGLERKDSGLVAYCPRDDARLDREYAARRSHRPGEKRRKSGSKSGI
jgi:hypothetical protein